MKTITITIPKTYKCSYGHQNPMSGLGIHADKRTKRNRSRANIKVNVKKDYYYD